MPETLNFVLLIFILFGFIYQILSLIYMRKKFHQGNSIIDNFFPKVSILKPLKGIDDELEENLTSFFELDYPNYELIFAIDSYFDPSYKIVKKLTQKFRDIKSSIIISDNKIGLNPKVNNLHNALIHASGEIIFISDSNTRISKDFLRKILTGFQENNIGLISAQIKGIKSKNIFAAMENIHLVSFAAPSIVIASEIANIQITVGKAILIRKNVLDEIGGFFELRNYLAEDHLMGIKVKEAGYKVVNSSVTIDNVNVNWNIKKFLNRHIRWSKIRANISINYFVLEPLTNPILFAMILFFANLTYASLAIAGGIIFLKSILDYIISRTIGSDLKLWHFILVAPKDLLIFFVWLTPFFSRRINWRGNKVKITKNSLIYIDRQKKYLTGKNALIENFAKYFQ